MVLLISYTMTVVILLITGPGYEFITGSRYEDLLPSLKRFSNFLGDKLWFAGGDQPTVADFIMYEYVDCACLYHAAAFHLPKEHEEQCLQTTPNLSAFRARFRGLPHIEAYLGSPRFLEVAALNNQHARFR
jgi:glutathione S-transferase